ncbi:hypothetical protein GCM10010909_01710 [Acidocella aquatica]|uniref:HTH marR-type domain-containing protein n=1 Tax=Acidocella aquatica TaxID=1922313 RepID=A0ABQ6A5J9_9PROT|nr:MarR family transcriptional regulator [Acidocella aquatica]GLR65493.1 hypothetical protein GCM10010909_01710 [Acidocella aquatica]
MAKTERIPQRDIYDLPDFPSRRTAPYLIQQLARLMATDYHTRVAATGVAPAQAYVLRELWRNEPLSQVEISERLDIGKATVGQSLKRLERAGFIERRRNPEDGRVIMVHLTEKGRGARAPLAAAAVRQVQDIAQVLGAEAARALETQLELLVTEHRNRLKR